MRTVILARAGDERVRDIPSDAVVQFVPVSYEVVTEIEAELVQAAGRNEVNPLAMDSFIAVKIVASVAEATPEGHQCSPVIRKDVIFFAADQITAYNLDALINNLRILQREQADYLRRGGLVYGSSSRHSPLLTERGRRQDTEASDSEDRPAPR